MQVKWRAYAAAIMGLLASGLPAQAQQKSEIAVSRQPGILYMPTHIIEKQKLIEKHAARLGLPNVTTRWVTLSGGGGSRGECGACTTVPPVAVAPPSKLRS